MSILDFNEGVEKEELWWEKIGLLVKMHDVPVRFLGNRGNNHYRVQRFRSVKRARRARKESIEIDKSIHVVD